MAEGLGGHLATIADREEERVLFGLPRREAGAWIGLDGRASLTHWTTGEPVVYTNYTTRWSAVTPRPKYLLRRYDTDKCWHSDFGRGLSSNLLVEWED